MRRHLTYANVVSSLCLFILLGGSAYAASTITGKNVKNSSLTGKDIKNSSVTGSDVKNRSLTATDFRAGQLPRGATGATGPQGPAGPAAATAFASVSGNGGLNFGKGVVGVSPTGQGAYSVTFNRSPSGCVALGTQGYGVPSNGDGSNSLPTGATVSIGASNTPNSVNVAVANSAGAAMNHSFMVALLC